MHLPFFFFLPLNELFVQLKHVGENDILKNHLMLCVRINVGHTRQEAEYICLVVLGQPCIKCIKHQSTNHFKFI